MNRLWKERSRFAAAFELPQEPAQDLAGPGCYCLYTGLVWLALAFSREEEVPNRSDEKSEPEVRWMERIARGDEEAFRSLVGRYERQILNLAYRYCGDVQESRDLAQEIFLKVFLNAGRWRPRARFSSWLFRVAVNHCLNHSRRKAREPLFSTTRLDSPSCKESEQGPDRIWGPEDSQQHSAERERALRVRQAVLSLPPRQRLALILHRYHGFSYREIADHMECSQGAVESLLVRAMDRLRDSLGDLVHGQGREPADGNGRRR